MAFSPQCGHSNAISPVRPGVIGTFFEHRGHIISHRPSGFFRITAREPAGHSGFQVKPNHPSDQEREHEQNGAGKHQRNKPSETGT